MRNKPNASAEVDFLLASGPRVIPVEVKAGATGRLKSLHLFLCEKHLSLGVRFNSDIPSLLNSRLPQNGAESRPFRLLSLPFYLLGQTRRLCEAAEEYPSSRVDAAVR